MSFGRRNQNLQYFEPCGTHHDKDRLAALKNGPYDNQRKRKVRKGTNASGGIMSYKANLTVAVVGVDRWSLLSGGIQLTAWCFEF